MILSSMERDGRVERLKFKKYRYLNHINSVKTEMILNAGTVFEKKTLLVSIGVLLGFCYPKQNEKMKVCSLKFDKFTERSASTSLKIVRSHSYCCCTVLLGIVLVCCLSIPLQYILSNKIETLIENNQHVHHREAEIIDLRDVVGLIQKVTQL